jgi:hypothetical protein
MDTAPREVLTPAWRQLAEPRQGSLDRRFYTFCVLERLQDGLHRRDLFVTPSERWGDPRAKLLRGEAWEAARASVSRTLDRKPDATSELDALSRQLDEAYRHTAASLPSSSDVCIERVKGKDRLSLSPLDKLDESPSLTSLKEKVTSLLPRVDLPDALLEIHALTGFADEFSHVSEADARVEDLALSICAVLIAEACNIGLVPVARSDVAALTYARLAWVQQNYLRPETLVPANARLVKAHSRIPLTKVWGGGEVASADGLRFVVPVRSLHAGYNSKYFHMERGVTYYNFVSNQAKPPWLAPKVRQNRFKLQRDKRLSRVVVIKIRKAERGAFIRKGSSDLTLRSTSLNTPFIRTRQPRVLQSVLLRWSTPSPTSKHGLMEGYPELGRVKGRYARRERWNDEHRGFLPIPFWFSSFVLYGASPA